MPTARPTAIALFCLILAAPPAQMLLNFTSEPELTGVTSNAALPSFSWQQVSRGAFQTAFETWLNQHMGFRAHAIKTDSQINLELFRESSIKTADVPIVGHENFIYARIYIDDLNGRRYVQPIAPETIARRLRRLQEALRERGKAFVFVIGPSKATLYPEYIPRRFLVDSAPTNASYYARMVAALSAEGVRTVDAHALFVEQKRQSPWLLFPPGGIHWLAYGAAFAAERMTQELEQQTGRPMTHVRSETVYAAAPSPGAGETDIALLLNTWTLPPWNVAVPHPRFRSSSEGNVYRPRVLMVGDSFAFGLIDLMDRFKVYGGLDLYYYYSSHYRYPGPVISKLNKPDLDWEREFLSRDAVIIEINEVQLDSAAWGFVDDALRHLDTTPLDHAAERSGHDGT